MAWGMWKDGWALMANSDGTEVFPLWPAREYAELHRSGDWADYEVREIALVDLIDELVPKLAQHRVLPGVFPTPTGTGVTLSPEEFAAAIRTELENYE
jgi:MoxR-like ATPase